MEARPSFSAILNPEGREENVSQHVTASHRGSRGQGLILLV